MPTLHRSNDTAKHTNMKMLRDECGMTLLELVVVMGVLAIMFGIIFPIWTTYSRNSDIKTEAQKLSDDIKTIRNRAINNEQDEFVGSAVESVIGYYILASSTPELSILDPNSQSDGQSSYQVKRLIRNRNTGVLRTDVFKTVNLKGNVKLYRGQSQAVTSIMFSLPFGKTTFYNGEPDGTGTQITALTNCPGASPACPCTDNSTVCSVFYAKKDNNANYYFRLETSQEGVSTFNRRP